MPKLPPVNEETVIFKSDRQTAGKVCKQFQILQIIVSLWLSVFDFLYLPKKFTNFSR